MKSQKQTYIAYFGIAIFLWSLSLEANGQLSPEVQLGSRIPVKPRALDPVSRGVLIKNFARCLYHKKGALAENLLNNSDPKSIDYDTIQVKREKLSTAFGMDNCLSNEVNGIQNELGLKFYSQNLRALLQEESYLEKIKVPPVLSPGSPEFIDRHFVSVADELQLAKAFASFADCLTFKDTLKMDAVLRTMPGSQEERASAKALAPLLGACLVQGQTLSLTPSSIRVIAADGLWSRYVQSGTATMSASK